MDTTVNGTLLLPNELWVLVFEALNANGDILRVMQTCQLFRDLALRVLYRFLVWSKPGHLSTPFWSLPDEMTSHIPISVTVSDCNSNQRLPVAISRQAWYDDDDGANAGAAMAIHTAATHHHHPHHHHPWLNLNGNLEEEQNSKKLEQFLFQTKIYEAMAARISKFHNLRSLTFDRATIPNPIYPVIHTLPHLKRIVIKNCQPSSYTDTGASTPAAGGGGGGAATPIPTFHSSSSEDDSDSPTHTPPSITSLVLWGTAKDFQSPTSFVSPLSTFCGPLLRTLRIDWCQSTARFFSLREFARSFPRELKVLEISLPGSKAWTDGSPLLNLVDPLVAFLRKLKVLRVLRVIGHLPRLASPTPFPPLLETYIGPLEPAAAFVKGGQVKFLKITNEEEKIEGIISFFESLSVSSGVPGSVANRLVEIDVRVMKWDMELLYATSQLFPELEKIVISWRQGYIHEVG
jgi:hypothetical protein